MPPPPLSRQPENRKPWTERVYIRLGRCVQSIVNGSVALLAKWLLIMAVIELVLFLTTTTVSALQTDVVSLTRDLTYAVIGAISSWFGMFGAKKLDRGVILLYFVLLVWGISATTTNITANFLESSKQGEICAFELKENLAGTDTGLASCSSQHALLLVKLVAISANIILQVLSAWVSLRLSEKIQEEADEEEEQKEEEKVSDINKRRGSMMHAGRRKQSISIGGPLMIPSGPLARMR